MYIKINNISTLKTIFVILLLLTSVTTSYAAVSSIDRQLLEASSRGDTSVVKELISKGADIDARDVLGNTPLIIASDNGYQEIVRYLISKRAAINAINDYGYSALLSAMANAHRYIVSILLSAGADESIANKFGTSPLTLLYASGYSDFKSYINDKDRRNKKFAISPVPKRGSTGALHNSRWREHFNMLVGRGDNAGAAEYLVGIASNSNFEAQYLLGMLLVERGNYEEGFDWLFKSTKSNDKELLYNVGSLIINNEYNVPKAKGVELIRKAMKLGSLDAKVEYAKCELFGIAMPMNYANAIKSFKEATENGSVEAEYYLGYMTYTGRGVTADVANGLDLIKSAAKKGFEDATMFIARLQSEDILRMIAKSAVKDRAKLKSDLISYEAIPIENEDEQCDSLDISKLIVTEYGIERVDLCYRGDGKIATTYYTNNLTDTDLAMYLQNISKDANFKNTSE